MSKTVLITGVSGQDGSLMADYLLVNTDYKIYGMVRRTAKPDYSNLESALKNPNFKLVTGDLGDSQSIDNLVRELKPDYFINFAAQSFVGSSWQIPLQTIQAGTMGVVYCLEAIRNYAPKCRFYNAGSSEEFGDVVTVPQNENHPPLVQSPYGAAKAAARHFVRVYRQSYNLYAVQGYLFNHEGVRRGEEFVTRKITKGVARIVKAINEYKPYESIELGNVEAKRDWSDAEDFVDGVWRMLNQDIYSLNIMENIASTVDAYEKYDDTRLSKEIKEYVLSSNETHTVKEFIDLAFATAGLPHCFWKEVGLNGVRVTDGNYHPIYILPDYIKCEDFVNRYTPLVKINPKFYRAAEVKLLHGDSSLARTDLGWKPKTAFSELVKKMVVNDMKLIGAKPYTRRPTSTVTGAEYVKFQG